jgi:hypothetical protein
MITPSTPAGRPEADVRVRFDNVARFGLGVWLWWADV